MAKKKEEKQVQQLKITPPRYGFIKVQVGNKGLGSSLIVHRVDEKTWKYLEARGQNAAKSKTDSRAKRDAEKEFRDSMYYMPESKATDKNPKYGIPAAGFKKAMVRAAKPIEGLTMIDTQQSIFVYDDDEGLVKLTCKDPRMRTDVVNIGNGAKKNPDLRYRGEFLEWSCKLNIRYDADFFTAEEVLNLLARAGFAVGWGEMRPEKGYSHGQYEIQGTPTVTEPK